MRFPVSQISSQLNFLFWKCFRTSGGKLRTQKRAAQMNSSFAREERLERPTPGFGDQCSTN